MKRFILVTFFVCFILTSCGKEKKDKLLASEDAQNGWISGQFTQANEGYYYSKHGVKCGDTYRDDLIEISYVDTQNNKCKVWCYKPDCKHNDESCNGIFSDKIYCASLIFYNDGKVYMVSCDDKGYYLESFDEDGSNQSRICKICDRNTNIYFINIHRGNIFLSNINGVYKISMETGNTECIISVDEPDKKNVDYIYFYDNMLYFPLRYVNGDVMGEDVYSEIYSYNIDNKEVKSLYKVYQTNLLYFITLDNENIIYYKDNSGLCKYNISDGSETIIFEEEGQLCRNIATNGKYIFIDNSKEKLFHNELYGIDSDEYDSNCQIQVISLEGELLQTFDYLLWFDTFYFGEKYLFKAGDSANNIDSLKSMWYILADDFALGKDTWVEGCSIY